jgi:hypothetical protein
MEEKIGSKNDANGRRKKITLGIWYPGISLKPPLPKESPFLLNWSRARLLENSSLSCPHLLALVLIMLW